MIRYCQHSLHYPFENTRTSVRDLLRINVKKFICLQSIPRSAMCHLNHLKTYIS